MVPPPTGDCRGSAAATMAMSDDDALRSNPRTAARGDALIGLRRRRDQQVVG
jgi:hypothetical protein